MGAQIGTSRSGVHSGNWHDGDAVRNFVCVMVVVVLGRVMDLIYSSLADVRTDPSATDSIVLETSNGDITVRYSD